MEPFRNSVKFLATEFAHWVGAEEWASAEPLSILLSKLKISDLKRYEPFDRCSVFL
jgi:hypothetical protein